MKEEHAKQMQEMQTEYSEQIQEMKNEHSEKIQELQTEYSEQIQEMKTEHSEKIQEIQTDHSAQMQEVMETLAKLELKVNQEGREKDDENRKNMKLVGENDDLRDAILKRDGRPPEAQGGGAGHHEALRPPGC